MSDHPVPVPPASSQHSASCGGCGARVEYAPGTHSLRCPYCGYEQALAAPTRAVREHSFAELAKKPRKSAADLAGYHFVCSTCGAHTQSQELSRNCQFCASPLVVDTTVDDQIAPEAVLPFELDRTAARAALRDWTRSRWFAPNRLKKVSEAESMKSTYLPHWTFDAGTVSKYVGQRGEYYYVTETDSDGNERRVRKTRWYPAQGTVSRHFDDVLVIGTEKTPPNRLRALSPWPLERAQPYQPGYLAGHQSLRYDVEPEAGLAEAKQEMASVIRSDCRAHIGGDTQRILSVKTRYSDITYKLMLLPVWTGCYLYNGKSWQILVNGCTGEIQGDRPYSAVKITFAIIALLLVLLVVALLASSS